MNSAIPRAWTTSTRVSMVDHPVTTSAGTIPAKLFLPESGHGAGMVVVQEIFGVSNYILQRAADLADEGWTVLVPNLYWRIDGEAIADDDPEALEKAMALMQANPWDETVADIRSCAQHLRTLEQTGGRAGLIGFCYGGGLAYAASSGVVPPEAADALVSYYGSALPELVDQIPVVDVPSLHHFGEADAYIPFAEVQRVASKLFEGADVELCSWPGAGHAFDNPLPAFHHKMSSEDAWRTTLVWLYEHFPA